MMRGENTDSLPTDLIMEIFSRLPAKSLSRSLCLSKLWGSILRGPYFTDLFLTRSSAQPLRLLIAFKQDWNDWCFFSSPQHQNTYEKSSPLVVAADFHMKFRGDRTWRDFRGQASSLILFRRNLDTSEEEYVICNPSTGQFATLPLPKRRTRDPFLEPLICSTKWIPFLGFDPINKEFKVLSSSTSSDEKQIWTLGTGSDSWRKIHCPLNHYPCRYMGICISGVLYYFAKQPNGRPVIVCFDVRSEKFKFIHRGFLSNWKAKLINYKGKLGVVTLEHNNNYSHYSMKLCLWIMNDVENLESEWSECVCNFEKENVDRNVSTGWEDHFFGGPVSIVGMTATGDIVLSMERTSTSAPFYVIYINPETNTIQFIELQGLRPNGAVQIFVDYVEDLKFINTMTRYAATN